MPHVALGALLPSIIGGVASIGGAILGSKGAKSAAQSAATASANNNALQGQIYQQNTANLSPFLQRGNAAGSQLNALLGLGGSPGTAPSYAGQVPGFGGSYGMEGYGGESYGDSGFAGERGISGFNRQFGQQRFNDPANSQQMLTPGTPGVSGQQAASDAFNQFRNSTGYQFRLDQGLNAVNTNHALRGSFESGAAAKELNNYAQGQASNEFGQYAGMLQNQQGVGLSGANALAGVGTNYGRDVASNNNNAAGVAGNAAMSSANGWANAFNTIGGSVASLAGSSYGGGISKYGKGG